jgi:hypothetical protein
VSDEVVGRRHALELDFRVLQPAIELGEKQLEGAIGRHTQECTLVDMGMPGAIGRVKFVLVLVLGLVLGSRPMNEVKLWATVSRRAASGVSSGHGWLACLLGGIIMGSQ